ncbi:MAG TPA: 3-carboxy-cis,cis-muconate cycloisomerase [Casimicrobiaceae bacterium]|nr:3-carboxy-cis,cis-muconate cycloisomerase [Casimicrobiaceae bacterium]
MIDPIFSTEPMRAIFAPSATLARMLAFEAALARAEGAAGVIPAAAAAAIAAQCSTASFDAEAIAISARAGGNRAIPLVAALTARVDAAARGYVHWGATSQDVIDTALVLQLRDALGLLTSDITRLGDALAAKARTHRDTPLAGRTLLQQALPVTLGFKLATTLSAWRRHGMRLADAARAVAVLQFGGAAGTLASLGASAPAVERALAGELGLAVPDIPWHTQRDRLCDVAAALGGMIATLGKLARDISLLAQTEVGEAHEPATPGRGGSSTLPHKRNPVGCAIALAAAVRAPNLVATMLAAAVQEHERGLGDWPAEWDVLPDLCELAAGALAAMAGVVEGLEVDAARMRANLDATHGQILAEAAQMALAAHTGRDVAHALVADVAKGATRDGTDLGAALKADTRVTRWLDVRTIDALMDPAQYLGLAGTFVDRVLAAHAAGRATHATH